MSRTPLVEAAGDYLTRGLQVIALTGKTPNTTLHKTGLKAPLVGAPEGPEDWDVIASVFDHPETTGVGILTTWPLIVVDIDSEVGAFNYATLIGEDIPGATWIAKTRKGLHLYYGTTLATGTFKPFGNEGGVDLKGDGGYVVAPPSAHPDGGAYRWLIAPDRLDIRLAPEALLIRIERHLFDIQRARVGNALKKPKRQPRYVPGGPIYAQIGYASLIDGMKKAGDGNRNNYLHWAAATLAEEGGIEEDFDELQAAALKAGLEPVEVERTIRSARRLHAS